MNQIAVGSPSHPCVPRNSELIEQVLQSVPAVHYGVSAMLRLLSIEESTEIPTACVSCGEYSTLRINPEFCARHAATKEKMMMLVLHELHHIVLGHTRLFPRATKLDNIVFDAVINAMLCHANPAPAYTAMFRDLYDEHDALQCLLRPASGWVISGELIAPPGLRGYPELAQLHKKLYSVGCTYGELRDAVERAALDREMDLGLLLGNHDDPGASLLEDAPALTELVQSIVDRLPCDTRLFGRSIGELLRAVRVVVKPTKRGILRALLRKIGRLEVGGRVRRRSVALRDYESPIPRIDRRGCVLRALGSRPLHFTHSQLRAATIGDGGKVHVYFDVSGSMQNIIAPLCAAIADCAECVHPRVHLFSTEVADVTLGALRAGALQSTGGTCIACVAEHVKAHGIKRAVIVTDGLVGALGNDLSAVMQGVTLGIAMPEQGSARTDLEPYGDEWTMIPEDAL